MCFTAACAAHDPGASGRGGRYSATDRTADGWTKTRKDDGAPSKRLASQEKGTASKTTPDASKPPAVKSAPAKAKSAPPKSAPPANSAPPAKTTPPKHPAPAKPAAKPLQTRVAMLTPEPLPAGTSDFRRKVITEGQRIIEGKSAKPPRQDCSGYVMAVYARAGQALEIPHQHTLGTKSAAEMLYKWAKADGRSHKEKPEPGDLAFFRDTWGKIDGRITHVAIVESVDADGNVKLIHNIGGRYRRSPMNLQDPHEPLKNGFFRKKQSANEPVLSGELFVAYGRPAK